MNHTLRHFSVAALCILGWVSVAIAQPTEETNRLYQRIASGGEDAQAISIVRETALREVALTVGAQAGLKSRSCEIAVAVHKESDQLDARFRFNSLMMGAGMLPPVISEARDTVARERTVMRIASIAYRFDEPAMLVDTPPTWRNWLYSGLDVAQCSAPTTLPSLSSQLRPQNDVERRFVKTELEKAFAAGRQQAQNIFDANLARLERTHRGMRRYFELFERGMVSAPQIVSATDVVSLDDPNTMIVGNTVIRIARDSGFVVRDEEWKPLAP